MNKNHLPGIIVFIVIMLTYGYYSKRNDYGYYAEVPGTDRYLVKTYQYRDKKWVKLHREAMEYYMRGDYQQEEKIMQKIIDQTQSEPAAYSELAAIKIRQNEINLAEIYYKKALRLAPRTARGTAGLAAVASNRGQHHKSIKLLLEALGYDPHSLYYHYRLASEYEHTRQYDKALKHYVKVVNNLPKTTIGVKSAKRIKKISRYLASKKYSQNERFTNR